MSAVSRVRLTPHGLTVLDTAASSLQDAVRDEPFDGVYTVDRTYPGARVLRLDRHFDRLEESALREGMPIRLDRDAIRAALREMLARGAYSAARFRISVARTHPEDLLLSLEPFAPLPADVLERGVRCVTAPDRFRDRPETKTLDWMHGRAGTPLPPGIFEALLLGPGGVVLEGTSSNFYGVTAGAVLRTAADGVLPGIARGIVLEIAPALLRVSFEPVTIPEVTAIEAEAFLTSSTRGIVPVVEIDGAPVGAGERGPWTKRLQSTYAAWVEAHLQPL